MQDDEQAIRELVTTWMTATKAGDSETVLNLMTDDAVFLVPGEPPFGKPAFAEATQAQSAASVEVDGQSEVQEIRILGDWAFMITKLRVTATRSGSAEAVVRSGYTLSVLRKEDGHWRLARDANLLAPVAAADERN